MAKKKKSAKKGGKKRASVKRIKKSAKPKKAASKAKSKKSSSKKSSSKKAAKKKPSSKKAASKPKRVAAKAKKVTSKPKPKPKAKASTPKTTGGSGGASNKPMQEVTIVEETTEIRNVPEPNESLFTEDTWTESINEDKDGFGDSDEPEHKDEEDEGSPLDE